MPDHLMPGTWNEAFAALPQEAPPAQGWERVAARMDGRSKDTAKGIARRARSYGRAPAWIGLAAAATLAIILLRPDRTPFVGARPARDTAVVAAPSISAGAVPGAVPGSSLGSTPASTHVQASTDAAPVIVRQPDTQPSRESRARRAPMEAAPDPLPGLYAESAQLEALLAVARDDRVSSAGAALLGDELDAQVASIDASLSQPGLDDGERLRFWRARVDALRQAAGFESTQRLLASQGRSDVMLVSVD